jgi:futalosine hydrolase
MHLLLCSATEFEIAPSLDFIHSLPPDKVQVLVTGTGLVSAVHAITKEVINNKPFMIIQAGLAGSLDEKFAPGTVVLVQNETLGDEGAWEQGKFTSLFDLGLKSANLYPWTGGKLCNAHLYEWAHLELPVADGVTVNEVSTREETISYYRKDLNVQVESMEGAALHYVALMEKIPFIQLRSVSNQIGERDKNKWMLKEAVAALNIQLKKLIINLLS